MGMIHVIDCIALKGSLKCCY